MGLFSKIKDALADVQQQNRENAKEKTAPKEIFDRLRNKLEEVQKEQQTRKSTKKGRTKSNSKGSIFSQIMDKFDQAKEENAASKKEETADNSILDQIHKEMEAIKKDKKVKVETKAETSPDWGSPSGIPGVDSILGRVLAGAQKEQQAKKVEPEKAEDFGSIFDSIMNSDKPKASRSNTKKAPKVEKKPTFGEIFDQLVQEEKKSTSRTASASKSISGLQVGGSALVDGKGGSLAIRTQPKMNAGKLDQRLPDNVNVRLLDYNERNKINLDGKDTGWYLVDYQGMQGWVLESYLE